MEELQCGLSPTDMQHVRYTVSTSVSLQSHGEGVSVAESEEVLSLLPLLALLNHTRSALGSLMEFAVDVVVGT